MRVGLDRKQGPVALRQRTRDEGLQRGHLLRCDGQPGDAVGAEDILELLRADTRHQHQPVAAPERCDHVAGTAVQQVAPVAEAEQQVVRVGKYRGQGLQRFAQVRDRNAKVHVPAALDDIEGQAFGGGWRRGCRRTCPRTAAGSER